MRCGVALDSFRQGWMDLQTLNTRNVYIPGDELNGRGRNTSRLCFPKILGADTPLTSQNNHYVPQYYLKGFTDPSTSRIFMFFKDGQKPVCTSVQSVANQTKYWSEETEQQLANLVEEPAKPVLDKIKVRQPITPEDKWLLSRYIITLVKRVPAGRAKMLSRAPAVWRETMDKVAKAIEEEKSKMPASSGYLDQIQRHLEDIPPDFLDVVPPLVWEQVLSPEMTIEAVQVIHQMKWTFFVAQPEKGFVTSDNPVIYTERKGLKPPEGELVFPVCRDVALWAHWTSALSEAYYPVIKTVLDGINFWLVASATDYIFYPANKNFVSGLVKRVHRWDQKKNATK